MIVRIKKSEHIKFHLQLMNGFLGLTSKEADILSEFIKLYEELLPQISNKDILNSQLFSSTCRKQVREKLEISSENLFNNYFKSLKDKGVIEKSGNSYKLSEKILQKEKISFEVEFID
jgi:biotin operon repressor